VGSIRIFSERTPIFPLWFSIPFLAIIIIGGFILMLLGKIPWPTFDFQ
jgi:Trk-type K+ transport system membrane component